MIGRVTAALLAVIAYDWLVKPWLNRQREHNQGKRGFLSELSAAIGGEKDES